MTVQQIVWMTCGYAVAMIAVVYFTRAVSRRVVGALVGGAVAALLLIEMVAVGETIGLWHWQFHASPTVGFAILFFVGSAVSFAPIYLVTWRVARRFGRRGLAVTLGVAAMIGPPRDYLVARFCPEWGGFASGIGPVIGDAIAYVVLVAAGHAVMRIIAGPANADHLARQSLNARGK